MEHANRIIAWELLFIAVFASLIVINSVDQGGISLVTGHATVGTPTKEEILTELETGVPTLSFVSDFDDVSVCLIVNVNPTTTYSYEIVKIADAIAVTSSDQKLCKGTNNEDFIVSYISYEKLKSTLDSKPTITELKDQANGDSFYIYPSKYIEPGFTVSDPVVFKEKFGTFLGNLPQEQVNAFLNPSSPEERSASSLVSYTFYFVVGLIAVVILVSVFIFTHAKKPEVKQDLEIVSYIKSSLAQGYDEEQVREALLASGWTEAQIQEGLNQANADVTRPEGFT